MTNKRCMRKYLSDEDKEYLIEETRALTEIGPLYNKLYKRLGYRDLVMGKILIARKGKSLCR